MHASLSYTDFAAGAIVGLVLCATLRAIPVLLPIILLGVAVAIITTLFQGGVSEIGAGVSDIGAYVNRVFVAFSNERTFSVGLVAGMVLAVLGKHHSPYAR
jgi:hypothetical protein